MALVDSIFYILRMEEERETLRMSIFLLSRNVTPAAVIADGNLDGCTSKHSNPAQND